MRQFPPKLAIALVVSIVPRLAAAQSNTPQEQTNAPQEQMAAPPQKTDPPPEQTNSPAPVNVFSEPASKPPGPEHGHESLQPFPEKPSPDSAPPEIDISGAPGQGLTVRVGDQFSLNLRSRVQLRYQLVVPPANANGIRAPSQQQVSIGTLRLYTSGNLFKPELTYFVQLAVAARDYRDGSTSPVYDAFLDWKPTRDFNIRAGQFFVPFDRLRTIREFALQIPDRARPVTEFSLDRDVGVTLYSEHFLANRSPVTWRVGAFGGGGTNLAVSKRAGALLVARLELRPLGPIDDDSDGDLQRRDKPGLAMGVGFAQNWHTDRQRSTTGSHYANGTIDYTHVAADAVFKWHGFAIEAEYIYRNASSNTLVGTNAAGATTTEYSRSGSAWIVQASYAFDPPFEVVGRLSRTKTFEGTDPSFVVDTKAHGQEVGGAVNYYLNAHFFKFQASYTALTAPNFNFHHAQHTVLFITDALF